MTASDVWGNSYCYNANANYSWAKKDPSLGLNRRKSSDVVASPSLLIAVADRAAFSKNWNGSATASLSTAYISHGTYDNANIGFVDGHVANVPIINSGYKSEYYTFRADKE